MRHYNYTCCILLFLTSSLLLGVEKPTTLMQTCVTSECHNDYQARKNVHGPVSLGDCKSCHKPVDPAIHSFQLARQGKELCSFCHLEQTLDKHVHAPVETGQCTDCHDPHSSDYKYLIPVAKVSDLCHKCHEEVMENKAYLHGPVAAGECTLCHNSHSSDHEKLLLSEAKEICFFCHESTGKDLEQLEYVHEPVKEGCFVCHDPHGSNNAMILKKDGAPVLCYSCHQQIKMDVDNVAYSHEFIRHQGGCTRCHTPHASSVRAGLKADPMNLCLECHDQDIQNSQGQNVANLKSQIENKKYLHGPVAQKDCKSCHASHGSDHFRFLTHEYPSSFYAPFDINNYKLCFTCHPETLVLHEQTDRLTDFRNGSLNLHYLHVNKPEKGRTCRACHATHGSNWPKHISEGVPYGNWEIPILYEKTVSGGGCQPGCHKPKEYDRENPVQYDAK